MNIWRIPMNTKKYGLAAFLMLLAGISPATTSGPSLFHSQAWAEVTATVDESEEVGEEELSEEEDERSGVETCADVAETTLRRVSRC